jgi:signal transduction histidine kinase/CheY-like chemotaxis protein
VTKPRREWLDARLDQVSHTTWPVFLTRSFLGLGCAVITTDFFGWIWGAEWFAAFLVTELGTRFASRAVLRGRAMTRRQRAHYLLWMFLASGAWCAMALKLWMSGEEALRLGALAVVASVLIHAQAYSFRTPAALIVLGSPAAALWVVMPLALGGYPIDRAIGISGGLAMVLVYVAMTARANAKNIEAREAAERQAVEANEAKSAFVSMVSHELRTPLNGVLGMTRALMKTGLDARQKGYADTIIRSGDGMLAILNELLDLSKIEAGRMDLEAHAFDPAETARHAAALWSEAASAKGLLLACDLDPALPQAVMGDEARVRQIMLNLLSNALKFTDKGSVTLRLAPRAVGGLEIAVADTGPGMTPEQVDRLFQPFVQAEASTARRFGGTGLGLSICRKLTTLMGGEIEAQSTPGQGTTFRAWLPLAACEAPAQPQSEPTPDELELPSLSVLVVDDNPINLAVARALLEASGLTVETADNGAQALERLKAEDFDLALMDVHMPVMDGAEAVRRLRAGEAGPAGLPVIALTGDTAPEEAARLMAIGFDAVQPKPIQPAQLIGAIAEAVEARAAAQAKVA